MMDQQILAIAIGLVVSLLFTEVFGFASGGMIVPGYVALSLNRPLDVALTVVAALATVAVMRLISRFAIVYGRRRIVLTILLGFLIGSLIRAVPFMADSLTMADADAWSHIGVVGYIIPGLIALWIDRQGIVGTLGTLATSSVVVRLVLILIPLELLP